MKAYNFNAGPCVLPKQAIESAIEAIRDFDNTGIGILEISHRTPGWERIMAETEQLWRELLNIPEDYAVMFLGGGASTQFFEVPANLLKTKAAYLQTGVWAKKAAKEAKFYGEVEIVASSEDKTYSYIPKGYTIPTDADYFHITTNNTIYGTEIHAITKRTYQSSRTTLSPHLKLQYSTLQLHVCHIFSTLSHSIKLTPIYILIRIMSN